MKYTILTIDCGHETVELETDSLKDARAEYLRLKECNCGRVRIDGGEILPIYKADELMLKRTITPRAFVGGRK